MKRAVLLALTTTALLSCSASSAGVPATVVGEWLLGPQYPADVYTTRLTGADDNAQRLVLNADGTYLYTEFKSTQQGTINQLLTYTAITLNSGCKRSSGTSKTKPGSATQTLTWTLSGSSLILKDAGGASTFVRRKVAAPPPASAGVSADVRGEWHSGSVSPVEYYNAATGKWAEASGTSVILKIGAGTYERTGLTVVSTYGCTSKLLVTEKGTVKQTGSTLNFTPTTSAATGYTCSPDRKSSAKNNVKPYAEQYAVQVQSSGQHVLTLKSGGGQTLFGRPRGTAPESVPSAAGTLTPPPVPGSEPARPAASPDAAPVTPAPWTATGHWTAVITTAAGSLRLPLELDDDYASRLTGEGTMDGQPVAQVMGSSATGGMIIFLTLGDELQLRVKGTFTGNTYRGIFVTDQYGEPPVSGTITMTR